MSFSKAATAAGGSTSTQDAALRVPDGVAANDVLQLQLDDGTVLEVHKVGARLEALERLGAKAGARAAGAPACQWRHAELQG